jgi:hypothetical protein
MFYGHFGSLSEHERLVYESTRLTTSSSGEIPLLLKLITQVLAYNDKERTKGPTSVTY